MNTKDIGNLGEDLACAYLVEKGYIILGRNYRITFGEIDIIAKKKGGLFSGVSKAIHFVEVKTLASLAGGFYPEEHVDKRKQHKLTQLAQIWLEKQKFPQNYPYQIDIISVTLQPTIDIHFFENAISYN